MNWEAVFETLLKQGPLVVVLFSILYGGYKRIWAWGYQLEEMRQDRDDWKDFALNGTSLANRAVDNLDKIRKAR